jgi:restriction endonuclease S subunit
VSSALSLTALQPNSTWATLPLFDRTDWKRVRFGDVVRQLKEQVNPEADGIERYVAGEHMETENVHIRKWGTVGDGYLGPAFIRGFRKGQVLYGSRRTYLKKVAVAEWDGVTANTTFVIEAVEGKLLQELLPWIMLSERFTKHSVQESKGSTNPYINFPDIAKFEFALPPLEQQRRIAEILWAVDEATRRYADLHNDFATWHETYRDAVVMGKEAKKAVKTEIGPIPVGWKPHHIRDLVVFIGGAQPPRDTFEYKASPDNVRLIQIRDYKSDDFLVYIRKEVARRPCDAEDVMIGRYGPPLFQILRGLVGSYNVALIKADPSPALSKRYLYHFLKQRPLFELIDHLSQRSAGQTGIDMDALKNYPIPLPPMEEQLRLAKGFDDAEELGGSFEEHIGFLRDIINRIMD